MMAIKKIRVKNFKSFKDLELSLGKVNILIGANGSGKSNFVDIIRFLKDIANYGLENSISIHGGIDYIKNINIGSSEPILLEITYNFEKKDFGYIKIQEKTLKLHEIVFSLILRYKEDEPGYDYDGERYELRYRLLESDMQENQLNDKYVKAILYNNNSGLIGIESNILELTKKELKGELIFKFQDSSNPTVFGQNHNKLLHEQLLKHVVSNNSIYDFNPKFSKPAVPIFAKAYLEEDGSNLVIVIKKILDDPEKKRMFMNLVSYLLPYVEDIKVDKFTESHYYLRIKETYSDKHYLPAPLISDGTINALGLIVALYFQESPLVIIEEPDKGFHPSLISRVIGMMKDVAENGDKQIIVTTHSPEMVRHADKKDIFLVSRDEKGFSSIRKPYRKKDVKIFLENGMRLSDLYVDELLEI